MMYLIYLPHNKKYIYLNAANKFDTIKDKNLAFRFNANEVFIAQRFIFYETQLIKVL